MRTLRCLVSLPLVCFTLQTQGGPFEQPVPVTGERTTGVFHHLDSAGRRNIALSGDRVAVVWEDNRDGTPRVYMASKTLDAREFDPPLRISTAAEAFEPAVTDIGDGLFMVIWEEADAVFVRRVGADGAGPVLQLSTGAAGHGTLGSRGDLVFAAWREKRDRYPTIFAGRLRLSADGTGKISAEPSVIVDPEPTIAPQLYPALAVTDAGIAVAWEDRRAGHTRLLYSHSADGRAFTAPDHLNEFYSNRNEYDRGSGVTRVALAAFGADEVLAAWMDKRRNRRGYSIYSALGSEGGRHYGPNERVQSDQGDELPHYNPSAAGNHNGDFIVAWDDYRSGTADIWLSGYGDDSSWSEDISPIPASGPGEQSNPSVVMDEQGKIHLVWLESQMPGGPTRVWYTSAQINAD